MEQGKYILNYWLPKDIPEVIEPLEEIRGIDKLIFYHQPYPQPHRELDKFIQTSDYDYIIIVTTDVVVKQENINMLIADVERFPDRPIISGLFNVDMAENRQYWNICLETPEKDYKWVKKGDVSGMVQVKFAGFPLMAIHKSVYKKYNFYIENYHNNATDKRFCKWCEDNNIPIWVNTNNEMYHMRYHGEFDWTKEPRTIFIKALEDEKNGKV